MVFALRDGKNCEKLYRNIFSGCPNSFVFDRSDSGCPAPRPPVRFARLGDPICRISLTRFKGKKNSLTNGYTPDFGNLPLLD